MRAEMRLDWTGRSPVTTRAVHKMSQASGECDNLLVMPKKPSQLSHYDAQGQAHMVDVSSKARTAREAEASAFVRMTPEVLRALPKNPKGDPLEVARTAGIMAAKRTAELIPMCHPVALSHVAVTLRVCENGVSIDTKVKTTAETGVEMEAMVAASVAALTVYDMCKALDKGIEIREVVLERKSGGKSGDYRRSAKRK
jgi:cyclic pyranopterin phosphate synthase